MNTDIDQNINDVGANSSIYSPTECQRKCQHIAQCESFVWVENANNCHYKSGRIEHATRIDSVGIVSGPRECGKIYCILYITLYHIIPNTILYITSCHSVYHHSPFSK